MKKTLYVALAAAAVSLGAVSAASAAVPAKAAGEALRNTVAPLVLMEKTHWTGRHHRHCAWRHHRRICWWN